MYIKSRHNAFMYSLFVQLAILLFTNLPKLQIMKLLVYVLVTCLTKISVDGVAESVLHENVNFISVDEDKITGALTYKLWKPSSAEIQQAETVLGDPENVAMVQEREDIMKGNEVEHSKTLPTISTTQLSHNPDFIEQPVNLTYFQRNKNRATPPLIVETLLVLDKEFSKLFQNDRVKILNYLTIYFWDVNMRFKTLPSVDLTFRVTGVVGISTAKGQPFIEQARDSNGTADFNRILPLFSNWVEENIATFPKFDLAVAITNTKLAWGGGSGYGGLAYTPYNCKNRGGAVFRDDGRWNSITVGTHELAHTLNAPHDSEKKGCPKSGYIMTDASKELQWFFSECSDKYIKDYVTSDQAACLRRIDESGKIPISSDFSSFKTPTMDQQCKNQRGPTGYVKEEDTANCTTINCKFSKDGGKWTGFLSTVENSPCLGGGRCFRGRCRSPDFLVRNVGSGQCLKAPNPFAFKVKIEMLDCPRHGTPLDRFAVSDSSNAKMLGTPWQSLDGMENGERCIYTGKTEGDPMFTDKCNDDNRWHGWDFIDVGNREFLLQHRVTKRCAKQVGNGIQTLKSCDKGDNDMKWKLK